MILEESLVLMGRNIVIYKGITYEHQSFFENIKLKRKRYIIILDEDIYVKKISINTKSILNYEITKIKEESFGKDEEYLIDYNINKKENIVYIYAIKGGNKVSKLCYGAKKAQVVPLQFYVMRKLKTKIKDKVYGFIFKYSDNYYYYFFNKGFVEESYVLKDVESLMKKASVIQNQYILYIEKGIDLVNFKNIAEFKEIELRRILNERVFI